MKPLPLPTTTFRYPLAEPDVRGNEEEFVRRAVRAAHISGAAPEVRQFEAACAQAVQVPYALAASSGTAALHLALVALGVGPGDEVLVPDLTYVAAANVVRYAGAKPVLIDVDADTWTIDPQQVATRIGRRTKAILAVHVYGNPADLGQLRRIARAAKVALVEDAAEAFGATWQGRPVGGIGDVGCFSLFANKVVTTGEGGLITTRSARLAREMRALRDQAKSAKRPYYHAHLGFSYRLSALQAAFGLAQLERLDEFVAQRARIRAWYGEELSALTEWREPQAVPGAVPVNWLYTGAIVGWSVRRRDRCLRVLRGEGIDARPVFVPMSDLPEFRGAGGAVARRLAASGISLPTYTRLRRRDVAAIAAALVRAVHA